MFRKSHKVLLGSDLCEQKYNESKIKNGRNDRFGCSSVKQTIKGEFFFIVSYFQDIKIKKSTKE